MIEDKRGVGGSRFEVGGWGLEVRGGASETAFTEWSFENEEI